MRLGLPRPCRGEMPVEIALYLALSKGEKMDFVVQKAVELGVGRIVPVGDPLLRQPAGQRRVRKKAPALAKNRPAGRHAVRPGADSGHRSGGAARPGRCRLSGGSAPVLL